MVETIILMKMVLFTLVQSRRDVLRAISTIVQYVSDLNDPVACKAKAVLGSFKLTRFLCREESCTMEDTVLTDFFHYQQ